DERFRAALLISGGFAHQYLSESDPLNFAPRVTLPVLLLNDRLDTFFPVEESQLPFLHLLGTPEKDKKYVVFESTHGGMPIRELIRESLDWLDKYLGPVKR
ncbi:MAG: eukaryotic-like serine/threonine-protein kinase, partial [Acidobacteriota bacterium]|nr:eukaryotic-like serine/threonine-protein kinase [Acidobacteriota bacterium]